MSLPLAGIRVLELGRMIAAPWAGQMLADLGAEVIKVEAFDGDPTRKLGSGPIRDGDGQETGEFSVFAAVNRNKKSISVNLGNPEGVNVVKRLAARSDVFIENYKVDDLERRGLGFEAIKAVSPKIVYIAITGFGQTGPHKHLPGMDNIVQGLSGFMSMAGEADGPPGMSPVAVMDFSAGMHATVGILAALFGRERGGKGAQYIDVSLLESGVAMLGYKMIAALLSGGEQPARGVRHKGFFPGGVFETADGWLQLTVGTDADFTRFCHATDRRDLLADDRYLTRWTRTDNHVPLMAEVRAMFKTEPTESWVARLNDAGVMAGGVLTLKEASEHEQIRARNAIVQIPHAAGGVLPIVANPIRNAEWEINYLSPPLLGADSDYILSQLLDLAPSEIDHLREVGALAPFARDVLSKPEASHGS